jgi:hypothetical protein
MRAISASRWTIASGNTGGATLFNTASVITLFLPASLYYHEHSRAVLPVIPTQDTAVMFIPTPDEMSNNAVVLYVRSVNSQKE